MLRNGEVVIVDAAFGRKLTRRVVEDRGDVVLITTDEEFVKSKAGQREPVCVGFKRTDVYPQDKRRKQPDPPR